MPLFTAKVFLGATCLHLSALPSCTTLHTHTIMHAAVAPHLLWVALLLACCCSCEMGMARVCVSLRKCSGICPLKAALRPLLTVPGVTFVCVGAPRAAEIANLLATLRGDQHRSSDASGQLEPPELRRPSAIGVLQQQQPYLQRPGQEPSYLQPSFPQPIQQLSSFLQPAQQSAYLQPAQQQQLQAYLQQPGLEQSYLQPSYLQPAQQLCLSSAGDFLQPPDQVSWPIVKLPASCAEPPSTCPARTGQWVHNDGAVPPSRGNMPSHPSRGLCMATCLPITWPMYGRQLSYPFSKILSAL